MRYEYLCSNDGVFEIQAPMKDGPPPEVRCPICHETGRRVYGTVEPIYYTDGFHKTDYDKAGHKQDQLRKRYELQTGEKAPIPDPSVERNAKRE